jgi:hypothetical protein
MQKGQTLIDWQPLVDGYNKRYKTKFKELESLLKGLYPGQSPRQIGDILGVSYMTIYKRLDYYGIERRHLQGGPNFTKTPKQDAFLAIPEKDMRKATAKQIAYSLDSNISTIYKFAQKHNRSFLKQKRGL